MLTVITDIYGQITTFNFVICIMIFVVFIPFASTISLYVSFYLSDLLYFFSFYNYLEVMISNPRLLVVIQKC